jgi:imidazolonepropionase-like amidohydrolase
MPRPPYRIADITVVDPRDGSHATHQDVHIADGRITAVTDTTGHSDHDTVDGRGRYVVPGYTDMHAHPLTYPNAGHALALMLAYGITGYRQMSGTPDLLHRRRTGRLDLGDRAPRLLAMPGSLLTPLNAGTPNAAIAEARRQVRDGADFLKAALITPEVYFAVQKEATRLGIPVCGHLPAGIDVRAAAEAGFRSIEHLGPGLGVLAGCSCHEEQILADTADDSPLKLPPIKLPQLSFLERMLIRLNKRMLLNPAQRTSPAELANLSHALDTFDEEKARELARHFAAHGTWNCPTLIRIKAQELCDTRSFSENPHLRYVTPKDRTSWHRAADAFAAKFDAAQREIFAAQFDMQLHLVKIFATEGVPLLAGTDAVGAAWVVPGASLHDEFDLLADAGLDPLHILQSTTSDAARFLGRDDLAGTVEAGKEADLVLLDADPTAAAENLHTISGVVCNGIHHSDADLAALKDELADRAAG